MHPVNKGTIVMLGHCKDVLDFGGVVSIFTTITNYPSLSSTPQINSLSAEPGGFFLGE